MAGNVTLEALLGAAPVRPGTRLAVSLGTYAGNLLININCDSTVFSAADAERFVDALCAGIVASGGAVPPAAGQSPPAAAAAQAFA